MLNRVGQRLLQLFEGASAAYSLRDLASNIASVVRVRRASDNSEKDFSAADVSSGAMTQWVNAQVVPPLDVRELVDGERTGALIPAAAAYSLRNLSASYTGDVVDVRRSSDNAEDSFTAAEVADGTLTDWVNTDTNGVFTNTGFESFSGASASGFTASNTSSTGFAVSDIRDGVSGDIVKVSFDIAVTSGSPSVSLREVLDGTGSSSSSDLSGGSITSSGSYTVTLTANKNYVGVGFTEGDTPSEFTVSNFKILADGFVTQWYDQSGNANHATQADAASQPKIVDAGSYLGYLTKNSSESGFNAGLNEIFTGEFSLFYRTDFSATSVVLGGNGTTPRLRHLANQIELVNDSGTEINFDQTGIGNADALYSLIRDSSNNVNIHKSGVLVQDSPITLSGSLSFTHVAMRTSDRDGIEGNFYELIIYNSDQSDNRTAIEANIGETYGIDLPSGVDTGYDQVDGFVETWYDQSGNGNDAVQETAGSQPKIVDAGVLVSGGILSDGAGTFLELDSVLSITDEFDIFFTGTATASNWTGLQRTPYGFSTNSDYPRFNDDSFRYRIASTESATANYNSGFTIGTGTPFLYNFNRDASDSVGAQINGTAQTNRVALSGTHQISQLFRRGANTTQVWDGTMSEMIFYNSDQLANRAAIETNINNQYDIY